MIEYELKKAAAAAAGYTVAYSGIVSGWGCRWVEESGRNAEWGWNSEEEAWGAAFAHLCRKHVVYRHKKGGIYRWVGAGAWAVDGTEVVIYEHLAPHPKALWVRPEVEFNEEGRFVRIHE